MNKPLMISLIPGYGLLANVFAPKDDDEPMSQAFRLIGRVSYLADDRYIATSIPPECIPLCTCYKTVSGKPCLRTKIEVKPSVEDCVSFLCGERDLPPPYKFTMPAAFGEKDAGWNNGPKVQAKVR